MSAYIDGYCDYPFYNNKYKVDSVKSDEYDNGFSDAKDNFGGLDEDNDEYKAIEDER